MTDQIAGLKNHAVISSQMAGITATAKTYFFTFFEHKHSPLGLLFYFYSNVVCIKTDTVWYEFVV